MISIATEGAEHPNAATFKANRGKVLLALDRPTEALPLLRDAWEVRRLALSEGNLYTLDARVALGVALCETRMGQAGREHIRAAIALGREHGVPEEDRQLAADALESCAHPDEHL